MNYFKIFLYNLARCVDTNCICKIPYCIVLYGFDLNTGYILSWFDPARSYLCSIRTVIDRDSYHTHMKLRPRQGSPLPALG